FEDGKVPAGAVGDGLESISTDSGGASSGASSPRSISFSQLEREAGIVRDSTSFHRDEEGWSSSTNSTSFLQEGVLSPETAATDAPTEDP
ncbi:unnamed protein product, partial [Amoebophrya sp. A25]